MHQGEVVLGCCSCTFIFLFARCTLFHFFFIYFYLVAVLPVHLSVSICSTWTMTSMCLCIIWALWGGVVDSMPWIFFWCVWHDHTLMRKPLPPTFPLASPASAAICCHGNSFWSPSTDLSVLYPHSCPHIFQPDPPHTQTHTHLRCLFFTPCLEETVTPFSVASSIFDSAFV